MSTVCIESTTAEKVEVFVDTPEDPTGAAVEYEITLDTVASPTGSWSAGSWESTWDSTTERATTWTPTIGASGTLTVVEGNTYTLWVRFSSTVIKAAATIIVT